jgi:hypothetical protein
MMNRKLHYLVKWKDFRIEHNSWEPWDNIHAPELVAEFYRKHPGAARHIRTTEFLSIPFRPTTVSRRHCSEGGGCKGTLRFRPYLRHFRSRLRHLSTFLRTDGPSVHRPSHPSSPFSRHPRLSGLDLQFSLLIIIIHFCLPLPYPVIRIIISFIISFFSIPFIIYYFH